MSDAGSKGLKNLEKVCAIKLFFENLWLVVNRDIHHLDAGAVVPTAGLGRSSEWQKHEAGANFERNR